ncbi:MAG: redox-regulated ATPase YchF, partial [Patescibacteria group bacterium]
IVKPERMVPAIVEFVDVAGLVKGASQGEGLGNQFLSHIRECQAIAQVLRFFEDSDVTHVHESVDPKRDREIIESELILADLQTLEKRILKAKSEANSGDKEKKNYHELLLRIKTEMEQGKLLSHLDLSDEEKAALNDLHLITMKPLMFIVNMDESKVGTADENKIRETLGISKDSPVIPIAAKVEAELIGFSEEEANDYLKELGLKETGLNQLIRKAYDVLGLQTYFTAGVKEVRAWTIHKGDTAPQAAGVIHTDFEKGFIRAEVIAFQDFVELGGEAKAKEKGKMRSEGKEYIVADGDVIHFRFSD